MYRSLFGDFDFMEMFLGWEIFFMVAVFAFNCLWQQPNHRPRFLHHLDFDWACGFVQHVRTF
jgi:hypothetical protein